MPVPASPLTGLEVFPAEVQLTTARDRQSIVVQATFADGITRDVTKEATFSIADPKLLKREGAILRPAADGTTTLTIGYGGKTVAVPVKVAQATVQPPLSFRLDVMPVFMRAGCNTGSCHGAARGKDGFRISLFGFDPEGDHFRLTREMVGRRVNLAIPSDSTHARKSDRRREPHRRQAIRSRTASFTRPFTAGSKRVRPMTTPASCRPSSESISIPQKAVLDGKGATQQLTVRARYSDGTDRDVTSLAVFLTNNDVSAPVSPEGLVTAGPRGEAFVMARFETHTVGSQFIVLPKGLQFTFPDEPEANYIDKLVNDKLKKLRIAPSGQCDDETFLRRAALDIVGLPPTVDEYNRFMSSTDPKKRSKWIDELLERKEFSEIWVSKWAELLQIRTDPHAERQSEGHVPVLQLAGREAVEEHADGRDGARAPGRRRRDLQEPGDQFLPVDQRAAPPGRERRPGLHGDPSPVRPVPQPSLRPLDPE